MNSKKLFSILASTLFFTTPFSSYAMNISIEENSSLNGCEIKTPCCSKKFQCFDLMKMKESSGEKIFCSSCHKQLDSRFLQSLEIKYNNYIDEIYKNHKNIIDIHKLSDMKGKNDKQIINILLKKWKNMIDVQVKYNEYSKCPGEILIVYVPDSGGFGTKLFSDINKTVVIKDKIFGEEVNKAWREFSKKRYKKSKSKIYCNLYCLK